MQIHPFFLAVYVEEDTNCDAFPLREILVLEMTSVCQFELSRTRFLLLLQKCEANMLMPCSNIDKHH